MHLRVGSSDMGCFVRCTCAKRSMSGFFTKKWSATHFGVQMKKYTAIWMVIVISFAVMGCNASPANHTIQVPPTTQPLVLFQDDFSDTSGSWYSMETDEGLTDYFNEGYRILVNRNDYYLWSIPKGQLFTDVRIEVDASKIGGPDFNEIGVICRYKDSDNFYFFTISSDGYYSVSKFIDGNEQWIGMDEPQLDDVNIHTGEATNQLEVVCNQGTLSLSVNGKHLIDVTDGDLSEGNVGLIAGTWDTPGTDILFDNFKVLKP
jgi:hypothetical protein